jgi:hypothetical protein
MFMGLPSREIVTPTTRPSLHDERLHACAQPQRHSALDQREAEPPDERLAHGEERVAVGRLRDDTAPRSAPGPSPPRSLGLRPGWRIVRLRHREQELAHDHRRRIRVVERAELLTELVAVEGDGIERTPAEAPTGILGHVVGIELERVERRCVLRR